MASQPLCEGRATVMINRSEQSVVYATFPTKEEYGYASEKIAEGNASFQGRENHLRGAATQVLLGEISKEEAS